MQWQNIAWSSIMVTACGSHASAMRRQVNEAVRISQSKAQIILNSKAEFRQAALIRVVPLSGITAEQEYRSQGS